jgi:hypothetical protein
MRMHAIRTGTVAVKQRQVRGVGQGIQRRVNTILDRAWIEPLPIYVWVIEHPEGITTRRSGSASSGCLTSMTVGRGLITYQSGACSGCSTRHRHVNTELLFGARHRAWSAARVREISPTTLASYGAA